MVETIGKVSKITYDEVELKFDKQGICFKISLWNRIKNKIKWFFRKKKFKIKCTIKSKYSIIDILFGWWNWRN